MRAEGYEGRRTAFISSTLILHLAEPPGLAEGDITDRRVPEIRGGIEAGTTMRLIGSLTEHLERWIARYNVALDYADARDRRRSTPEIEWNGEMIGDLRRRSSDA